MPSNNSSHSLSDAQNENFSGASVPRINLITLQVSSLEKSAQFYRLLGLHFAEHKHGQGPVHFCAELPGFAFELYPSANPEPRKNLVRIGFEVEQLEGLRERLSRQGIVPFRDIVESEWGRQMVVLDPDENRVELTQSRRD